MLISRPLTQHEKSKKELLSLNPDQLIIVVTLMLNKNECDGYDLMQVLDLAQRETPDIDRWSNGKVQSVLKALVSTDFVDATYSGYRLNPAWRVIAVFAADSLGLSRLEALVNASSTANGYPADGQPSSHWRRDYEDITQRAIHKILMGKVRDFDLLYGELNRKLTYAQYSQTDGCNRIDSILATVDWGFWRKRPKYFQWSAFTEHQFRTENWTERTPQELETMLLPLLEAGGAEAYLDEIRTTLMLGIHHFKNREELAEFDPGLRGIMMLVNGDQEAAKTAFDQMEEHTELKTVSIVHILKVARAYGAGELTSAELYHSILLFKKSDLPRMVNCFIAFALSEQGRQAEAEVLLENQFAAEFNHPLEWLVGLWCAAWMGVKLRRSMVNRVYSGLANGLYEFIPWVEGEIATTLKVLFPRREVLLRSAAGGNTDDSEVNGPRTQVQGEVSLLAMIPVRPAWEYALRQLRRTSGQEIKVEEKPALRTIWIVDFDAKEIYCKEQKQGKRGWTKGRKMKWYELISPADPDSLHAADYGAIAGLQTRDGRRLSASMAYNDDALFADFGRMLYELTEHPRVFLGESRRIPIELLRGEPELQITETPTGILMRFDPPVEEEGYVWKKETPTRYRIYHLTEAQAQMAWAIGDGVEMPAEQRPVLEEMMDDLRPAVAVQSSFDLIDGDLERIAGSPRPCFHLLPFGLGYKVELYVKPLPEEPFYFKPADGLPRSIIVLEDGRRILERNLEMEKEEAAAAILACPTLARTPQSMYEWTIEDTTTALRILLELRKLVSEEVITIEHPKGEKLKIVGQAGSDELAVRVGKNRDWFEVNGKLTVNEKKVMDLQSLFAHVQNQDNPFIELGEGEFVAITDELRDRILEMEGLLHRKGNKLQLPTLAAGAFNEIADDLEDLEFDDAWTESLERIKSADKIRPRVPKSFRAELRDYQKEGFKWMMRLAEWGVGGCLADDMGLGKTVQALAVLSARSGKGPSLVIAPASVTRNWRRETERFAPGLIPVLISSRAEAALLPELGPGDLALVSYGLLPFIGEELQAIEFANIVLDEAQAIKNATTKRAKIVQNLQGDFKLATTGTPIENHLGELWSLFRFLNPGLLSSKAAFNDKYNKPIARDGDEGRREALKSLVLPFILRRKKDQVLTELPPKTEIVLEVNLSEEEKALYEAMRRQAVEQIASADEQQKRFTVLAQLTKLRQAACHPRLVRPTSKLGSAKLELVGETLLEILEGGHKALIFSQFVKHLKIVENWVKGQGIEYQYLDGSTPGKKREESVNAFQAGEGQVFLISLKAGGTGLNLTEADYVLHLDPWWNPAAEDQASDRAHRIGQQRPVTVYRFVSQGTIEEQIIALHAEKRDLADQILSGTGNAGSLKVEDVLKMIRQS
jgi:superfamily II DNA or RNA helicase